MIINAVGFGGHLNFNNTGTQFEWIITSIQPQISTEHRNLYTTFGNRRANHLIKKGAKDQFMIANTVPFFDSFGTVGLLGTI